VDYLGIQVGHVDSVARDPDGKNILIEASLDRDPPLPANLRASIVTGSALGGASMISLDVGDDAPQGQLAANATINAKYVGLQLNLIPPSIGATAEQISQLSTELTKTVRQLRESGSIEDLDKALKNVSAQATKVGRVFDSLQTVLGDPGTQNNLHVTIQNLRTTTDKLNALADSLQGASNNASSTIKSAQQDIDSISKQIGDRLTQISAVLGNIQGITNKINTGQGSAGQLVNDPRLYQSLVDTSRQLDKTVLDLQRLIEQWEQEGVDLHLK
jgi:phospholipid/cholesterol/gamma-HCH transport system substrate-binding protein